MGSAVARLQDAQAPLPSQEEMQEFEEKHRKRFFIALNPLELTQNMKELLLFGVA